MSKTEQKKNRVKTESLCFCFFNIEKTRSLKVNLLINFYCRCADEKIFIPTYKVSKEKAESLGVEFVPLEVSIKETVESLRDKGFIRF